MRAASNPSLSCSFCGFASPQSVPGAIPKPRFRLGASTQPARSVSVSTPTTSATAEESATPTVTSRRRLILLRHGESAFAGRFTKGALLFLTSLIASFSFIFTHLEVKESIMLIIFPVFIDRIMDGRVIQVFILLKIRRRKMRKEGVSHITVGSVYCSWFIQPKILFELVGKMLLNWYASGLRYVANSAYMILEVLHDGLVILKVSPFNKKMYLS